MNRPTMIACSLAAAMAIGVTAGQAQTMNSKPNKADESFLKEAIQGDLAEVNMGKLAQEKGKARKSSNLGRCWSKTTASTFKKQKKPLNRWD